MSDQIEEVKSKTDIVSLVSANVELKKAGRNFKGLCPFHNEKTPSFMVSPELQIFKCFGCGESGDAIAFLQKYEGMDFGEALKFLADKAGVKLEPIAGQRGDEKEKYYRINDMTVRFYQYLLLKHPVGKPALDYLQKKRGLRQKTIETFKLGYSPSKPLVLEKYLVGKKGHELRNLEKAGLVYLSGGHGIDRFKGRVVFPLFNHRGNPVGFAGRLLPWDKGDKAKYINTPETSVYHKSRVLYGLDITKKAIKEKKKAVIVEGELDMISSWQIGIKNTVAIKGSALTEDQARLLSRFTKQVVLALDADVAGDIAARRGIGVAHSQGLNVRVAVMGRYKDPDEAARKNPDALKKSVRKAVGVWDYMVESVVSRHDRKTGEGKAKISKEIIPVIRSIEDKIVQAHYVELVAKKLRIPTQAVSAQVEKSSSGAKDFSKVAKEQEETKKGRRRLLEESLLLIAFRLNPKIIIKEGLDKLITTHLAAKIVDQYKRVYSKSKPGKFDARTFGAKLPKELVKGFQDIMLKDVFGVVEERPDVLKRELQFVVKEIELLDIRDKLKETASKIRKYEGQKETKLLQKEKKKFGRLTKKLSELEEEQDKGIIL